MKKISIARIYIDEFGFCRIRLDSSEHDFLGVDEAKELCDSICEVCDGTPHKLLTDSRDVNGHVGLDAREVIRNHPGMIKIRLAEAFVVNSLATSLIANFYVNFNRPENPTRVFNSMENAQNWLKNI